MLDHVVKEAAARITRLDAEAAAAADGLIVDIRSQEARQRDGVIPGSVHIPRTVLEWRVAPESPWRNPYLEGLEQQLILVCDHGYSSILAASMLVTLGFHRTADVIGGFEEWTRRGLPVVRAQDLSPGPEELPGMGPPLQATAPSSG